MTRLLKPHEAAPSIGVEPKTLANWRTMGIGPAFIKAGRNVLYDPADLESWKAANRFSSTSQVAA